MPSFSSRRIVPFTPRQMFDIVADVERYPEFLPLCESLTVTSREALGPDTKLIARMGVGYKSVRETFSTQVLLKPSAPSIDVKYLDGPFHHLDNRWGFVAAPGGSEIDFFIDYAFKSPMLALLMGAMFDSAFRKFSEAFDARARAVYGAPPGTTTQSV